MKTKKVMAERINTDNEESILQDLGIEPYMIEYLMQQKHKSEISERWR